MKKRYTILAFLLITASTFAQAPEKMSYQAVLRDATNTLLTNQSVGMQISILQTTITGASVYTETQTITTNLNGLVSLEIGTGSTSDNFATIDWSAGPYFIKIETDPTGGSSYTITGTSQIMSVPFAMYAKTSGSSEANATNISQNTTTIEINTTEISAIETDQTTQNSAIALNTAKVGITTAQATTISNTTGVNTGDQDISGIAANRTDISAIETDQTTQNSAIALNTAKVGITTAQATTISNTTGVNTGDQIISGIATNTTDISAIETDQTTQNSAIALNTAKVGITTAQATTISNTTGVNTGDQDISGIATNTTDILAIETDQTTQNSAIALNTAKAGITTAQATTISNTTGLNTGDQDISGIAANRTDISAIETDQTTQNSAIALNTVKVGINSNQANAIVANTAKVDTDATSVNAAGALMDIELTDLAGIKAVNISTLQVIPSEGAFVDGDKTKLDGIEALIAALEARIVAIELLKPAIVGDFRAGGIVFWVDPTDNTHGLVCALEDAPTSLNWVDAISYSNGYTNSDTGTGVYSNWYLPSKDELQLMYANLQRFGCTTNTPGGIDSGLCETRKGDFLSYLWSSTEGDGIAWVQIFIDGSQINVNKSSTVIVRAVRAF
jgi:hypothetical protein